MRIISPRSEKLLLHSCRRFRLPPLPDSVIAADKALGADAHVKPIYARLARYRGTGREQDRIMVAWYLTRQGIPEDSSAQLADAFVGSDKGAQEKPVETC